VNESRSNNGSIWMAVGPNRAATVSDGPGSSEQLLEQSEARLQAGHCIVISWLGFIAPEVVAGNAGSKPALKRTKTATKLRPACGTLVVSKAGSLSAIPPVIERAVHHVAPLDG